MRTDHMTIATHALSPAMATRENHLRPRESGDPILPAIRNQHWIPPCRAQSNLQARLVSRVDSMLSEFPAAPFAGMTEELRAGMTAELRATSFATPAMKNHRRPREGGDPILPASRNQISPAIRNQHWIPAFAGMTAKVRAGMTAELRESLGVNPCNSISRFIPPEPH